METTPQLDRLSVIARRHALRDQVETLRKELDNHAWAVDSFALLTIPSSVPFIDGFRRAHLQLAVEHARTALRHLANSLGMDNLDCDTPNYA